MMLVIVGQRSGILSLVPAAIVAGLLALIVALAYLVKVMILSSRKLAADAGAIAITHDPRALVSALRTVAGSDAVEVRSLGAQAMLFSASSEGLLATHPPIERRIEAIIRLHGQGVVDAGRRHERRPVVTASASRAEGAGVTTRASAVAAASRDWQASVRRPPKRGIHGATSPPRPPPVRGRFRSPATACSSAG